MMLDAHTLSFFHAFPDFYPDRSASPESEFARLASVRHWTINSPTWRRHWLSLFHRPYNPALDSPIAASVDTWNLPQYDTFRPNVFFEQYRQVGFQPNYQSTIGREFARLADYMAWRKGTDEWRERRSECFLREFERWWEESDEGKLEAWQRLCREVGIRPVPDSIRKCKVALKSIYINIVNLLNTRRGSEQLIHFRDYAELRKYSVPYVTFPAVYAKKEGLLWILLKKFKGSGKEL